MQLPHPQARLSSDVRCPVCGQGFLIYAESAIHANQEKNRRIILQALSAHHTAMIPSSAAHPNHAFNIPNWTGVPFSASASLSDLLDTAI